MLLSKCLIIFLIYIWQFFFLPPNPKSWEIRKPVNLGTIICQVQKVFRKRAFPNSIGRRFIRAFLSPSNCLHFFHSSKTKQTGPVVFLFRRRLSILCYDSAQKLVRRQWHYPLVCKGQQQRVVSERIPCPLSSLSEELMIWPQTLERSAHRAKQRDAIF